MDLPESVVELETVARTERRGLFRPIHYLGSKLRMLDHIAEAIDRVSPAGGRAIDLFAGSGSVAFKLSGTRPVTAVDIQEYSRTICSALLMPHDDCSVSELMDAEGVRERGQKLRWAAEPMIRYEETATEVASDGFPEPLCDMLEHGSLITFKVGEAKSGASPALAEAMRQCITRLAGAGLSDSMDSMVFRYFGGIYFSYRQAVDMDILLSAVHGREEGRDRLLAALLSTVSDAVNTVGKQFAQPIRPRDSSGRIKPGLARQVLKDRGHDIPMLFAEWLGRYGDIAPPQFTNSVMRCDYREALGQLPGDTSVIYADPPYTRDHYSRYYHVLETICLRDMPEISTSLVNGAEGPSRGLYRKERHQSPFCIKSRAPGAFGDLIELSRRCDVPLVISYSPFDNASGRAHPRMMPMDMLEKLARKHYRQVEITSPGEFIHSKLNRSGLHLNASSQAEVLVICQP
jgi:adenine-specific DNA-methyltransferase